MCAREGNRKALVEKSGLVKHAAGSSSSSSSKAKEAQSRQALSAEQQQRNTLHRSTISLVISPGFDLVSQYEARDSLGIASP